MTSHNPSGNMVLRKRKKKKTNDLWDDKILSLLCYYCQYHHTHVTM